MRRLTTWIVCLLLTAACSSSSPSAPAAAPAPKLGAGIDDTAIDRAVRPQDDLFDHVNGRWLATFEIPADKASYGTFVQLSDKAEADLKVIVEEAANARDRAPGTDAQKVGDFYQSFMNEAKIEELGMKPLERELSAIDAVATKADLASRIAELRKMAVAGPVFGFVSNDKRQASRNILYITQSGLGLPDRDYYLNDDAKFEEIRTKYQSYLAQILELAGERDSATTARQLMALETRLARAQWTQVQNRDQVKTYNKYAFAALSREMPGFDWKAWAQSHGISDASEVVIYQPSYAKAFGTVVRDTPIELWKPYLKFRLLSTYAPLLSKSFVDRHFEFYGKTLQGLQENEARWKRAISETNDAMGELVGKLYVERHFTPDAKARMTELVDNLKLAFKDGIEQLEWMGAETKAEAQKKLSTFVTKIGYPVKWRDYSRLTVDPSDLVGNATRAQQVEFDREMAKLQQPPDRDEWQMYPQEVNAYYNPLNNEIVFPAAILQPPFFNVEADDAVNYGSIGAVIGHEIGHGFDDQGRRYDETGNLRDWWTAADEAEFQKRAKLLVDQYNSYSPIAGMHVNGQLTLGENIGDLCGVTMAHRAYELSLKGKEAPIIDGMTGDQRYFMGWAQIWRMKQRDEAARNQLLTDPHAPGRYRVDGIVTNVPKFYEAFGLKAEDGLFRPPEQRVKIW